jgi:hypothetical protein
VIGPRHLQATAGSTVEMQDRLAARIARLSDSERDAIYLQISLPRRHAAILAHRSNEARPPRPVAKEEVNREARQTS